jgi:hypothetical protein
VAAAGAATLGAAFDLGGAGGLDVDAEEDRMVLVLVLVGFCFAVEEMALAGFLVTSFLVVFLTVWGCFVVFLTTIFVTGF